MQNLLDYEKITKIGLVSRPNSNLKQEIEFLREILAQRKIELFLEEQNANLFKEQGYTLDDLFKKSDIIISLGGDGTLISLCRKACEYEKAILGIYAGNLGFLTDIKLEFASQFFDDFFEGKFRVETPFLLDIHLEFKDGSKLHKTAFNEAVFARNSHTNITHVEVFRKGKKFNEYYGDGLIIATPAGSTAYNLSANGPIVYTLAEVFLLTPVCSHSLTQRPIVLPKKFELEIKTSGCELIIDGQERYDTNEIKNAKFTLSDKFVKLIHPKDRNYFQILKEKLHWGK